MNRVKLGLPFLQRGVPLLDKEKEKGRSPQKPPSVRVLISQPAARTRWWFLCLIGLISLGIVLSHYAIAQVTAQASLKVAQSAFAQVLPSPQPVEPSPLPELTPLPEPLPSPELSPSPESTPNRRETPVITSSFGHLPYNQTSFENLIVVGSYSQDREQRFERLNQDAGLALMKMLDAARLNGIWLVPVSGFRDVARQDMLFRLQVMRDGSAQRAARSVAPPGHSEHHTGYAVDLADGLARARDLSLSFGQTDAFKWLTSHAHEFGFELSFPQNNRQGVNYEPWHWRFVGTSNAAQTFAAAHSQIGASAAEGRM